MRTPIMIRWIGRVKPQRSSALASSIDLAPTLLAAAKLRPTPQMSGVNLLDEPAITARGAVFGECFTHNATDLADPAASLRWRWMIQGDWKLIVPDRHHQPDDQVELFDLVSDPFEEHSGAASYSDVVKTMGETLDAWWPGRPAGPPSR